MIVADLIETFEREKVRDRTLRWLLTFLVHNVLARPMTFYSLASLFFAMIFLASLPSMSVLTVVARALSSGFWHGSVTALGIVVGDIVFILLAVYGLSVIANNLSDVFVVIKGLGGLYLLWLGLTLWRAKAAALTVESVGQSSWISSFLSGLLITLGDQKAILFYVGFLPAFVDLSTLTTTDACLMILTAMVAVGGVKIFYAYMADRAKGLLQNPRANKMINRVAGTAMIVTGLYLVATAVTSRVRYWGF
ncbi:MAG: LysE family translocator [Cyanobacteria bacterium J06649_5]